MNYSENKKFYYFQIYHSEESAGTSNKYQSFYENHSHNDLEYATKSTFTKLVYGLKNEDDISNMFCLPYGPWRSSELEVFLTYYYIMCI